MIKEEIILKSCGKMPRLMWRSETLRRTGNAKNIDSWRYYVHICVYEGGTNSEDKVDPIDYFNTKFDRNGNEIND